MRPEAPAPGTRRRAILLTILKLVISGALLFVLFQYADMRSVLQRLRRPDPGLLSLSFLLLGVQIAISSIKWRLILRGDGLTVPFWTLLRLNATSSFLSLFLPSSFGGDFYRVAALRTSAGGLVRSTASVLFDRGTGLFALVTIAALSYQFYPDNRYAGSVALAWLTAIGVFFFVTSRSVVDSPLWPSFKLARHLRSLVSTLRVYRLNRRVLVGTMLLSLTFQFMMVVVNWLYAGALRIDIAFATLMVVIPLIYVTEVIPLSINGIGIRDSAFVLAFASIGRPAEEALAMSIVLISMRYLFGFTCGTAVLLSMLSRRRSAAIIRQRGP